MVIIWNAKCFELTSADVQVMGWMNPKTPKICICAEALLPEGFVATFPECVAEGFPF